MNDTSAALCPGYVCELLTQSLIAWRSAGRVRAVGGEVVVESPAGEIRVERAAPGTPFRWTVTVGERRRAAVSLVAVLRQVRTALDPNYTTNRVRIAVSPLLPE